MDPNNPQLDVFLQGRQILGLAVMPGEYDERVWMQQIIHIDHVAGLLARFKHVLENEIVEHRHQAGLIAKDMMDGVDLDAELRKLTNEEDN